MTTLKIVWTPTTNEPKMLNALAANSAFNLELCLTHIKMKINMKQRFKVIIYILYLTGSYRFCKKQNKPGLLRSPQRPVIKVKTQGPQQH